METIDYDKHDKALEVAKQFKFKNLQGLYNFTEYLSGAKAKIIKKTEEYEGEKNTFVEILYTDGDSGVLIFSSHSEIYEKEGVTISSPMSQWADISFYSMGVIQEILETFADDYPEGSSVLPL